MIETQLGMVRQYKGAVEQGQPEFRSALKEESDALVQYIQGAYRTVQDVPGHIYRCGGKATGEEQGAPTPRPRLTSLATPLERGGTARCARAVRMLCGTWAILDPFFPPATVPAVTTVFSAKMVAPAPENSPQRNGDHHFLRGWGHTGLLRFLLSPKKTQKQLCPTLKMPLPDIACGFGGGVGAGGLRSANFRTYSQFHNFPQLPFACPPCVRVGALCPLCRRVVP